MHPDQIAAETRQGKPSRGDALVRSWPLEELLALPPPTWRVKGLLPSVGLAAIYGPPSCGKSFLGLDVAMSIARVVPWFGRRTTATGIIYIAAEGETGFAQRLRAYLMHNSIQPQDLPLEIIAQPVDLLTGGEWIEATWAAVRTAEERIGQIRVMIIDTLNRTMPGGNENDPADMGQYVQNIDELRRRLQGLVLIVHHTPKDISRGPRGHGSLYGALDAAIEIERREDQRIWRLAKSRDGPDGEQQGFTLDAIHIANDPEGDPVFSCVVKPAELLTATEPTEERKLRAKDFKAFQFLTTIANGSYAKRADWTESCRNQGLFGSESKPDAIYRDMSRIIRNLESALLIVRGPKGYFKPSADRTLGH